MTAHRFSKRLNGKIVNYFLPKHRIFLRSFAGLPGRWPLKGFVFGETGIPPQLFKFVEVAGFLIENVDDGIEIVYAYPGATPRAFHVAGVYPELFFEALLYSSCNGVDLRVGLPVTDYKIVGGGIVQMAEIKFDNSFTFDILNGIDGYGIQFFLGPAQLAN